MFINEFNYEFAMNKILMWILISLGILSIVTAAFVAYESTQTIKKPAIYLYPLEDSFIDVRLDINGKIIRDIPNYRDGWNVYVTKEGLIENEYDYLFYEAKLNYIDIPDEGWIIDYDDLEQWFDKNLILLGLNEKELSQFKEYWLEELPESKYYDIRLLEDSFLKENMGLIISPEPDTVIRLNFYFRPLSEKMILNEPYISLPQRHGFTVVEWGGILAD